MTFIDFVTPVPADWLNNVNTFVNTSPTPAQLTSAYTFTSTAPTVPNLQLAFNYVSRYDHKNIVDFGAVADGVTDNTAAFNAALAACPSGRMHIVFPPGVFYFATPLTYTFPASPAIASITIEGCGQDVTELRFAASVNGMNISPNGSFHTVHIRSLSMTTNGAGPGSCYAINLVQQQSSIPNPANTAQSDITNVTIRGSDGYQVGNYFARGVNVSSVSAINFESVYVAGFGFNTDAIFLAGSSSAAIPAAFNFTNCASTFCNSGINYAAWTQGVTVTQCNFTGNRYGVLAGTTQAGLDQLSVTGCQFNCNNAGISLQSPMGAFTCHNSFFLVQNNSAGIFMSLAYDYSICGNAFNPAVLPRTSQNGITITGYQGAAGVITGNSFLNLSNGIFLGASSQFVNVQSNAYQLNTTNVANGGTNNTIGGGSQ